MPGNHDLERGDDALLKKAYEHYSNGKFTESITDKKTTICYVDYLANRFQFFGWVAAELDNSIWLDSSMDDRPCYHRTGTIDGKYNIVYLNTALGSGHDAERTQLRLGYEYNVTLYLCGDEHIGGADEYDSFLQLAAGCLNQEGEGIQPTFYIGELKADASTAIKAYTYQGGAYAGWTHCEPISNRINKWTSRCFPSSASCVIGKTQFAMRF